MGGDGSYNSAVFLQENSLVQGIVDVETQTVNSDNIALEGCIPASFTFSYDDISNQDRIINFVVGGSAVNGVDFQFVDSAMTIVAGDTSANIYIDAFSDGITEGQESVWIIYQPAACADFDTAFLFINDAQPIDFSLDGFDLGCFGDNSGEIQVNASGGFPPYTYNITYPDNSQADLLTNPITGLEAGTYTVQVTDSYGCQADALVISGVYDADTTFLPDVPNGTVTTYDAPIPIAGFNTGQTINNVNQIQQICLTMEHSYLGHLQIEVESPSGQIVILKQQNGGGSCDLGEPIATAPIDGQASSTLTDPGSGYEYCFNANPIYGTMVNESNNFTRNYTDAQGNNYTDTYLPAGSYTPFEDFSAFVGADMNGTWTVHVTDQFGLDNGYIFNWYISLVGDLPDTTVTLVEPDEIVTSGFVTNSTCGGTDGSINIDITGAVATYTVLWSSGQTTEDITGISAGSYTVTVKDGNGCQSVETFLVNNIGSLDITNVATATSCNGGSDGSIDINVLNAVAPISYSWSNGAITEDISGLNEGSYTVVVTDANNCSEVATFTIVNNTGNLAISNSSIGEENCGNTNGSINITVVGGAMPYSFNWSSLATTEDLTGLTVGTYTVIITDGNSCETTQSFTVINNAGTYTVVVTSAEGCDTTMTFEVMNTASIEENDALNISMSIAPNPATNQFAIDYKLVDGQDGKVVITDALGKIVYIQMVEGQNMLIVNSNEFANSMYFVTLSSRKITKTERLVITNK